MIFGTKNGDTRDVNLNKKIFCSGSKARILWMDLVRLLTPKIAAIQQETEPSILLAQAILKFMPAGQFSTVGVGQFSSGVDTERPSAKPKMAALGEKPLENNSHVRVTFGSAMSSDTFLPLGAQCPPARISNFTDIQPSRSGTKGFKRNNKNFPAAYLW